MSKTQPRNALLNVIRGDASDLGALQRSIKLRCLEETIADSWNPDPIAMFAKDKYNFDTAVPVSEIGNVEGPPLTIGSVLDSVYSSANIFKTNRMWMKSFPFEPRYRYSLDGSEIGRLESTNNVGYVRYNVSSDIVGAVRPLVARYGNNIPKAYFLDDNQAYTGDGDVGTRSVEERSKSIALWCFGDYTSGSLGKKKQKSTHSLSSNRDVEIVSYKARGFKYGLASHEIINSFAVYRSNRYGQFRDMLEQRQFTAFNLNREDNITEGDHPVVCSFRVASFLEPGSTGNALEPENSDSSNLSIFCTSSLPYFEDFSLYPIGRNRANPVPEQQVEVVEVN